MVRPIHVLHVDDDSEFLSVAAEFLERESEPIEVTTETDPTAGLARLETDPVDCVISDYDMPRTDGLELLDRVRADHDDLPFILFTGKGSEAVASDALSKGATDYLQKEVGTDQYALLANRVENAVVQHRSVAELERQSDILAEAQSIANLGVCEYDLETGVLWYSAGVAELFDLEHDDGWATSRDVEPASFPEYLHPADREAARTAVEGVIETGESAEFEARLDAAEERWLRVRCRPTVEGDRTRKIRATVRDVTGRVGREREMASRERIMERMGLGVYAIDAEGDYSYVNPAAERLTGYDEATLRAASPALVHPDGDIETIEAAIADLLGSDPEGVRTVEATVLPSDGDPVPVDVTLTVLTDEDGAYRGTVGVARDVSGRKETERRLREYESILRAIPDEVSIVDEEGYHVEVIPATGQEVTASGHRPAELQNEHVSTVMRDADVERAGELVEEMVAGERDHAAFEMDVITRSGEALPRENHMALLEDDDGSVRGTVNVLRDIEARRRRERELERYARLIEASGDAVYALDAEGRFTFSNEAHQAIVDRPEVEVLGEHASIALPDEAVENGQALIRELLASDRRCGTYEMDVLRPDGERIPTENHVALLHDENGEFRGTVGVLRDISERKADQRELERQNERLERFAEIASHDLRNPLNLAAGYLELLGEDCDSEHVPKIADALDRMEELIDDTLTMARQGATVDEPTAVDLDDLVSTSWAAVSSEEGTLTVVDPVTIQADETRARQVFENLLRNAVEHGGEDVSIRVGAVGDDGVYIADDGPGIPEDSREAVFEVGHTTASSGTGFGLAIVDEIARAHGWAVGVTESESGGARFEITGVDVSR